MIVVLNLTDDEFEKLWGIAVREGFKRTEPSKPWTLDEQFKAIRWVVARLAETGAVS